MGRLFGTNGVRGIANRDLVPEFVERLGEAIGTFFPKGSSVLVGRDTRTSGEMIESALLSGLLSTGVRGVRAGIVPTPTLQYSVREGGYAGGVVVTASHNPPEFNGIKVVGSDGTELSSFDEEAIEEIFFQNRFRRVPWNEVGDVRTDPLVLSRHIEAILGIVPPSLLRGRRLRVVLDTGTGASSLLVPHLLRRLGVHVETLNAQIDGTFPAHPSEPTPENLETLRRVVPSVGADLGVALDGDGDRCILVDEKGEFVPGDRSLALVAREIVRSRKGGLVVTPVSTSRGVEDVVKAEGGSVLYTKVGAPIVARTMKEHQAVFGGEENGGLIFPQLQYCRDGAMAVASILRILCEKGETLSSLLSTLPLYHVHKTKIPCPEEKKSVLIEEFARRHSKEDLDTTDGIKIRLSDASILVRPSGTEPIVRIYSESLSPTRARDLALKTVEELRGILGVEGPSSFSVGI